MIYLDNNGTTKVSPAVFEAMIPWLTEHYGNPSSLYPTAKRAKSAIEEAREKVAALLGCQPRQVIFTSCGTESNHSAILSALRQTRRRHILTSRTEHSAIMKLCSWLERNGNAVSYAPVEPDGLIKLESLQNLVRQDTAIVSVMWANNETGVLNPINEIAQWCHDQGLLFHTDAVQVPGKIPINLSDIPVDFLSISGHKFHAPKGIGALYIREPEKFVPMFFGGSQENGLRAGTEAVAQIVGLGVAAELALEHLEQEASVCAFMRDHFEEELQKKIPTVRINGNRTHRLPNTSNITIPGLNAVQAVQELGEKGLCLSTGSACTSGSGSASHVLTAMGLAENDARASLRISWSAYNTIEETNTALDILTDYIQSKFLNLSTPEATQTPSWTVQSHS